MQWLKRSLSASAIVASKANVSFSYSHTPSKFPMLGETFGQRLEWAVNKVPERDAFVFPKLNVRYSFAQYLQKVLMFITYLFYKLQCVYCNCLIKHSRLYFSTSHRRIPLRRDWEHLAYSVALVWACGASTHPNGSCRTRHHCVPALCWRICIRDTGRQRSSTPSIWYCFLSYVL